MEVSSDRGSATRTHSSLELRSSAVFSTSGTWFTTDELYFAEREFGGVPWEKPENFSRYVLLSLFATA